MKNYIKLIDLVTKEENHDKYFEGNSYVFKFDSTFNKLMCCRKNMPEWKESHVTLNDALKINVIDLDLPFKERICTGQKYYFLDSCETLYFRVRSERYSDINEFDKERIEQKNFFETLDEAQNIARYLNNEINTYFKFK